MESNLVVVLPPSLNRLPSFPQACEPVLVQTFVPHLGVEALDEGILHRLARLDGRWYRVALVEFLIFENLAR